MQGCYLIHFEQKHRHAQHYIGCSEHIAWRIQRHLNNTGAALLRHLNRLGIGWNVVRVWETKCESERYSLEKQLKSRKKAAELCPICNPKVSVDQGLVKKAVLYKP